MSTSSSRTRLAFPISLTYDSPTDAGKTDRRRTPSRALRSPGARHRPRWFGSSSWRRLTRAAGEMTITSALAEAAGGTDLVGLHQGVPVASGPRTMSWVEASRSTSWHDWSKPLTDGALSSAVHRVDGTSAPVARSRRFETLLLTVSPPMGRIGRPPSCTPLARTPASTSSNPGVNWTRDELQFEAGIRRGSQAEVSPLSTDPFFIVHWRGCVGVRACIQSRHLSPLRLGILTWSRD